MIHFLGPYRLWAIPLLLLLILAEAYWSWREDKAAYNLKESLANTVVMAGYIISKIFSTGYTLILLGFFYQFAPYKLPDNTLTFIITFVAIDFLYYWYHRVSHKVNFFWAFHVTHHSSQWMNLTTAYRINWFSSFITPLFFIPAALIGMPPVFIAISFGANLFYQFFMHTEAIGKIPFVEGVIDTPAAHRVHHGSNDIYIDKNFGGVLMIWDRIFGSYQPETEPVKYGVTTGFAGHNPFKLVFQGFSDLVKGKINYKG